MQFFFFFFNDTATTEIYTLSLHDALPIWPTTRHPLAARRLAIRPCPQGTSRTERPGSSPSNETISSDRKSTRLNSSHANISYAVFCLKKKKSNFKAISIQLTYNLYSSHVL